MSIRRWCVRISNWSRDVLLTCGERRMSKRCMRVGWGRALDDRAGALGGVDDLERRLVDQLVVERLQADADLLLLHDGVLKERLPTALPGGSFGNRAAMPGAASPHQCKCLTR